MRSAVFTFLRRLVLFAIPFLVLVAGYVYMDPFKVIFHYDNYMSSYKEGETRSSHEIVSLNKDFVSTENFLDKKDKYRYDSFILGSSRSMFYPVATWKTLVGSEHCYHFDASAETLFGITRKLQLMNNTRTPIKNVLIVLDRTLLQFTDNSKGHLYIKDPKLSGQNAFGFHLNFFKAFLAPKFFTAYIDYNLHKEMKTYMKFILEERPFTYDPVTNECTLQHFEDMIAKDPQSYYGNKMQLFYKRGEEQKYSEPVIGAEQRMDLQIIIDIFRRNHTQYKIVISPLYDQLALNKEDLAALREIFGAENVFDFSGINKFTADYRNYYETSHYRPQVAIAIMDSVYAYH